MRALFIIISLVAMFVVTMPRTINAATLTMEEVVSKSLQLNPALLAAAQAAEAANARPSQAATPPDLNFMVQFGQVPIDSIDVGKGTITYMLQQQIPFPAKLVYGYKSEKRAAKAMEAHREMTAQELKHMVKLAYLEVYRLQEEERLEKEALSALKVSKSSAEEAYSANEGMLVDPLLASVNMGEVEARLASIGEERLQALANLSALMVQSLESETKVKKPPKNPSVAKLGTLIERAKENRPDIKETEYLINSKEAQVALAKANYGPDLTLRWGYDDRYNQQDAWTGRVMVSVPLWAATKQRLGVQESKAMLMRAKSLNEDAVLTTEKEIRSAYAMYQSAIKRAEIYRKKVLPRAKIYRKSTSEAYRTGDGEFDDVVDGVLELRKAEIELIRANVDKQKSYSELERAVGTSIGVEGS